MASLAAEKCVPIQLCFPALCSCSWGGGCGKGWKRCCPRLGKPHTSLTRGRGGRCGHLPLGWGQSSLHKWGIEARERCSLGCWMGTRLRLCRWKTPKPRDRRCGKEFILGAGVRGKPNLSDLLKAIQGVCAITCAPPPPPPLPSPFFFTHYKRSLQGRQD